MSLTRPGSRRDYQSFMQMGHTYTWDREGAIWLDHVGEVTNPVEDTAVIGTDGTWYQEVSFHRDSNTVFRRELSSSNWVVMRRGPVPQVAPSTSGSISDLISRLGPMPREELIPPREPQRPSNPVLNQGVLDEAKKILEEQAGRIKTSVATANEKIKEEVIEWLKENLDIKISCDQSDDEIEISVSVVDNSTGKEICSDKDTFNIRGGQ